MKYKYVVCCSALAVGVFTAYLAKADPEIRLKSAATNEFVMVDTVKTPVRVLTATNNLLPFAYNSDTGWKIGGDSTKGARIRLTRMRSNGEPGNPAAWKELVGMSTIPCDEGHEGTVRWSPDYQSFVRVELVTGDGEDASVSETAFLDFSGCDELPPLEIFPICVTNSDVVSLDTRLPTYSSTASVEELEGCVPVRTRALTVSELLPLVYMIDWYEGKTPGVDNYTRITVEPVDGQGRTFTTNLTSSYEGTVSWPPESSKLYRASLFGTVEGGEKLLMTVDLDLTDVPAVEIGDLPDDRDEPYFRSLVVSNAWLETYGILPDDLRTNKNLIAANGLPVWKNYLFGLDPTNEISLLQDICQSEANEDEFNVFVYAKSGGEKAELNPRWGLVERLKYRLVSTNELSSAFLTQKDAYGDDCDWIDGQEQPDPATFTVPKDGEARFYRARLLFYWKGNDPE